jgi:hypothetical protein
VPTTGIYSGVVVTSSRFSRRRTSNCNATKLFAIATSGSQNSLETTHAGKRLSSTTAADLFDINYKVGRTNSSSSFMLSSALFHVKRIFKK